MKNKKKIGLYLLVGIIFLLIIVVFYNLLKINRNINNVGNVEGKICYPSSGVPQGYILAKNIKTDKITEIYFGGASNPEQQKFSVSLDEGKYVFAYKPKLGSANNSNDNNYGFFTSCALTTDLKNCSTPDSHKLTEVDVNKGETLKDVIICDYYYDKDNKPEF